MKSLKQQKYFTEGKLYINCTFNNTLVTLTDLSGNTLCWSSCGSVGFKGTRKNTPYAAQHIMLLFYKKIQEYNIKDLYIIIKGYGIGRDIILQTLQNIDFNIKSIQDKTPVAYNGCRLSKKRKL